MKSMTDGPDPHLKKSAVTIRPSAEADIATITAIYHHHVLHGAASFEI